MVGWGYSSSSYYFYIYISHNLKHMFQTSQAMMSGVISLEFPFLEFSWLWILTSSLLHSPGTAHFPGLSFTSFMFILACLHES